MPQRQGIHRVDSKFAATFYEREGKPQGWIHTSRDEMAFGAAMFSLPAAVVGTFYMVAAHNFGTAHAIATYVGFGLAAMTLVTLLSAIGPEPD